MQSICPEPQCVGLRPFANHKLFEAHTSRYHKKSSAPVAVSEPEPTPTINEPVAALSAKKRGRPRKHADDAAKQAAYRERKESAEQYEERLKLIGHILRRFSKQLSAPDYTESQTYGEAVAESNREAIQRTRAELMQMSIEDLRTYAAVQGTFTDTTGRKENETSGGRGSATIDRIQSARGNVTVLSVEEDDEGNIAVENVDGQLPDDHRVEPEGSAPDTYDRPDDITEVGESAIGFFKKRGTDKQIEREEMIVRVVGSFFRTGMCEICGEPTTCYDHAREYVQAAERAETTLKQAEDMFAVVVGTGEVPASVREAAEQDLSQACILAADATDDPHVLLYKERMKEIRKAYRDFHEREQNLRREGREVKAMVDTAKWLKQIADSKKEGWSK
jgi:hypothetical protein